MKQIEESGEIHLSDAIKRVLLPSDNSSPGEVIQRDVDGGGRFAQFHLNTDPRVRQIEEATIIIEARHQKMQEGIKGCLLAEGYAHVLMEENHVDISARWQDIPHFFEVKTFDNAKACIREAL